MRPLNQLSNGSLLALKTALDGYQRYQHTEETIAEYFAKILDYLIGPLADIDIWVIRSHLNKEDERRSNNVRISTFDPVIYTSLQRLTPAELRILKFVGHGYRTEIIADLLNIAYRTVVNHKDHITQKLGLGSVRDLTKFALDNLAIL